MAMMSFLCFPSRTALVILASVLCIAGADGPSASTIHNSTGLRILVAAENKQPTLRIVLPDRPETDRTIEVIFPEHVTARIRGNKVAEHLYLFQPGLQGDAPRWKQEKDSLQYERDLGAVHFLARAMLQSDGVLFHYQFVNRSSTTYGLIYAVTDPRLTGMFHDVRLERTYVHRTTGFDLLASETPSRLTMPLDQWLPARYLASFTWPVPTQRIERRDDGITYYNKSREVDQPLVVTLSEDRQWAVASFSRTTGNVWSNPELTCQHVDPEVSLAAHGTAVAEVKILILKGSLNHVLEKVKAERKTLK